jgi:hypothetical protein
VASGKGGSNALWECDCGNSKVIRVANVTQGKVTHCSDWTQHRHHMDPGETLSANAWHRKLSRHLGGAGTLPCALCGAVSDSNEWAYRHSSYEARCQLEGKDRGQVYSLDEGDYWVLCRSHHRRWDSGHSRTVAKGSLSLPHIALSMAYNPDYGQEALHG